MAPFFRLHFRRAHEPMSIRTLLAILAVAAYLLLVPIPVAVLVDRIGGHDIARILQLGLGLLCALGLAFDAHRRSSAPAETKTWVAAGLVSLLALASTVNAPDLGMAAREAGLFAGMAAVALVVARLPAPGWAPCVLVSAASATYVAVILILIAMGYAAGQPLNRAELFVGYDNYRFFNHVQSAALPLTVLAATWLPQGARSRKLAWFAAAGGFALLLAVVGRGTLLGLVVGALALAAVFGRSAAKVLKNLLLAALLGLLLFLLVFWLLPLLTGGNAEFSEGYYGARMGSVEARLYLWRIAVADIAQSPWLGIGPMHYALVPNGEAAHPHNIYLQIAAEWGLPMLILLITLGALALRSMAMRIRRCGDEHQRDCGIGLWFACVAIAIDGLVSGNFVMPVSQVWIAFTVGWAMAWCAGQAPADKTTPQRRAGMSGMFSAQQIVAIGLLASQVTLIWSAWPEIMNLDNHVNQAMQRAPSPTMNPRFWSHGWF